jgi:hypothetical protein
MRENAKEESQRVSSAAIAAILLQSEFIKKGMTGSSMTSKPQLERSKWKKIGREFNGI